MLIVDVPLSPVEAALGAEIDVPVLDGSVRMRVPAGDAGGDAVPAARQGLPARGGRRAATRTCASRRDAGGAVRRRARRCSSKLGEALGDEALPRRRAFRDGRRSARRAGEPRAGRIDGHRRGADPGATQPRRPPAAARRAVPGDVPDHDRGRRAARARPGRRRCASRRSPTACRTRVPLMLILLCHELGPLLRRRACTASTPRCRTSSRCRRARSGHDGRGDRHARRRRPTARS